MPIKSWYEFVPEAGLDHSRELFTCKICEQTFDENLSLYDHILRRYNVTTERYRCLACDKCCQTPADLDVHITNQHPAKAAGPYISPVATCEKCGKDCVLPSVLTCHMKLSKRCGGRTATCEIFDGCARLQQNDRKKNDKRNALHHDFQHSGETFSASISRGPKLQKDNRLLAESLEAHEAMCEHEHDIRSETAPRFATLRNCASDDYIHRHLQGRRDSSRRLRSGLEGGTQITWNNDHIGKLFEVEDMTYRNDEKVSNEDI